MLEKFLQKALIGATLLASAPAFADAPNPKLEQRIVLAQNDCPPYIPDCNRGKSGGYGQQPPGAQVYYPASRPATSEPRPLYLSPTQSPQYAQPNFMPASEENKKSGCGYLCVGLGATLAVACGIALPLVLKTSDTVREIGREHFGGQDPTSSTGPILLGVGIAGGLGLMIYGFMSK